MWTPEKLNPSSNKEKAKNTPGSTFENMKKAVDKVKSQEADEAKKDEKILNTLEQEFQASESSTWWQGGHPIPSRIQRKIILYKQQIDRRILDHPERPPEVGEAALSVLETIATSDQNPNAIARGIGKIMKLILSI